MRRSKGFGTRLAFLVTCVIVAKFRLSGLLNPSNQRKCTFSVVMIVSLLENRISDCKNTVIEYTYLKFQLPVDIRRQKEIWFAC